MLMFFAVFYFGLFFHDYLFYIQAVRDGARYASLNGSAVGEDAVKTKIVQYANNYNLYLVTLTEDDINVSWTADSVIVGAQNTAQLDIPLLSLLTIPIGFQMEMPTE